MCDCLASQPLTSASSRHLLICATAPTHCFRRHYTQHRKIYKAAEDMAKQAARICSTMHTFLDCAIPDAKTSLLQYEKMRNEYLVRQIC